MLSRSYSAAILGVEAQLVTVEANVSMGLPSLVLVGQASGAVYEGRERIKSALAHCGQPIRPRKQVVNLAPAQLRKDSPGLDLAVALALLAAHEIVEAQALEHCAFWAELGLDGVLRPVMGALLVADLARREGLREIVVAPASAAEAKLVPGLKVKTPASLGELVAYYREGADFAPAPVSQDDAAPTAGQQEALQPDEDRLDMSDIQGLTLPRLALETMVAGGHNLLMWGAPGVGKTMLAQRARGLCPDLTQQAAIERTKIQSVAQGRVVAQLDRSVPFRAPHHSVSAAGLLGGGRPVRPGEVSLAHRGLLFLDELPEFSRACIEGMREPLEQGAVRVVRAEGAYRFPADFQLIAAMNPCPCGYFAHPERVCICSAQAVARYQQKVSGPFVDRMDLVVALSASRPAGSSRRTPESSVQIRERIEAAQGRQARRLGQSPWSRNADLPAARGVMQSLCPMSAGATQLMAQAATRELLSLRAQHRLQKVARTLCDLRPELSAQEKIGERAVALALQLRRPLADALSGL